MDITNINQLLPYVAQKPEFIVLDRGDFKVIDYVYQDQNTFDIPELMECRGIKFCNEGLILARPFRKFFNYGERGADLPAHRPHVITEKLDGSMIHPVLLTRRLFFHTRKGHTDVAKQAERYVLSTPEIDYQKFCKFQITEGWTPIFEYTGPNNRIVLRYEEEKLSLLACRHMVSGALMSRTGLEMTADMHGIPLVPVMVNEHRLMKTTGQVDKFIKHARELEDAEGYVIYFDDGYMVKIKSEDYVLKHRALDDLGSKKKVVAVCAQGFMDDVIPILSEADANDLEQFNHALQQEIGLELNKVHDLVSRYRLLEIEFKANGQDAREARKAFAIRMGKANVAAHLKAGTFGMMDGKDTRLMMINHFIKHSDTVKTEWRGQ